MSDIRSPVLLYVKGLLFVLLGCLAAAILLAEHPSWKVAVLLCLAIWAFCRAYYFAFYVLGRYVDPRYKFAGLWSLVCHVVKARGQARDDSVG